MIIKNRTFPEMAYEISQKKNVYIWGAGMIGTVVVPEIFSEYGLLNRISGYIDNNTSMQGKTINIKEQYNVNVSSFDAAIEELKESVLIIAVSRFNAVIEQLKNCSGFENTICYVFPMMLISNYVTKDIIVKPQIPKVINYMWLGEKEIPDTLKYCMESWSKFCPDYEIKRWDETNYSIDKNAYMKNAYAKKKYGFVPDYARLDILYNHGGIYMDTDVELIKPLDDLLNQDSFCGVEKWQTINFGGCSGAVRGSKSVKAFIEEREKLTFYDHDGNIDTNTCGYYDTKTALKYGYVINGEKQKVLDMMIYSSDFFHPYDYMSGEIVITPNTHSIHHFNGGWLDDKMKEENRLAQERYNKYYVEAKKGAKGETI